MIHRFIIALIILLIAYNGLFAQDTTGIQTRFSEEAPETLDTSNQWISGAISISEDYNDNILDYSPNDITNLDSIDTKGKYAVGRLQDAVTGIKLRLSFQPSIFRRNPTIIRFKFGHSMYAKNGIKNYETASVEIRQAFWRKNFVSIGWGIIPSYYLRNLSYRDLTLTPRYWLKYSEARFRKTLASFELKRNFSAKFSLAGGYDYIRTNYNQELDERDNTTHRTGLDGNVRISSLLRIETSYHYSLSWARGRELSDTLTDISYRSHECRMETNFFLKKTTGLPLVFSAALTFEYQEYFSGKIYVPPPSTPHERYGDKYHYGRIDRFYKISAELNYDIFDNLQLDIQYLWEQNKSNLAETADAGSYQTHQAGIGFEFSF